MEFSIGDRVFLKVSLPYLKTAEPMPMLRPPDLVSSDELGQIVGLRGGDIAEVAFRHGVFLISLESLVKSSS